MVGREFSWFVFWAVRLKGFGAWWVVGTFTHSETEHSKSLTCKKGTQLSPCDLSCTFSFVKAPVYKLARKCHANRQHRKFPTGSRL